MIDFNADDEVYVYIADSGYDYVYPQERRFSSLGLLQAPMPHSSVFATFVVLDDGVVASAAEAIREAGGGQVDGIVQNWEWTLASPDDPALPEDFQNRYAQRMW